jgi:hypothetical protein
MTDEPSEFKGLDKFMSPEEIERWNEWKAKQRAEADAILRRRGKL